MKDLKLVGLKSHDCHTLMQQLLPIAVRGVLPKHVKNAITRKKVNYKVKEARQTYTLTVFLKKDMRSSVLCDDDVINRAILWKRGRLNKAGEFVGDELKQTVNKIDDYIVQKKDGKLSFTKPFKDILMKALNSNEHGGRVRGIGANVTPSSFFKVARGKVQIDKDAYDRQHKEFKEAKAMLFEQG
ncbi:uncharacterized protein LOC121996309 [Zingiber officinale]|uniref:uncharacterized protein LOC121996309 n=1 Tax=Zingiber officinale TaxID=94328 RepID=UPI001C4D06D4|nr:uncharacterized protein LOC121996309 [Zingiber officinale]